MDKIKLMKTFRSPKDIETIALKVKRLLSFENKRYVDYWISNAKSMHIQNFIISRTIVKIEKRSYFLKKAYKRI